MGMDAEFVSNVGTVSSTLANTTFPSWTPSTTAKAIKATSNLTTFVADMENYEYIIVWHFQADVAYKTGTTLIVAPVRECQTLVSYIFRRPSNLTNVASSTFNSNNTVSFSAPILKYYNSNGTLSLAWTGSYGLYGAITNPTFSNSTSASPTVTVKAPTFNARCSTSYMSTDICADIDQANTTLSVTGKLYRLTKRDTFAYGMYADAIAFFNEGSV